MDALQSCTDEPRPPNDGAKGWGLAKLAYARLQVESTMATPGMSRNALRAGWLATTFDFALLARSNDQEKRPTSAGNGPFDKPQKVGGPESAIARRLSLLAGFKFFN